MTHWVVAEWMREREFGGGKCTSWNGVLLIKMSNCCMWAIRRFSHLLRRTLRTTSVNNSERDTTKTTNETHVDAFEQIVLSQLSLDRNILFLFCKNSPRDLSPTNLWDRSPRSPSPFPLDPSDCRIKRGKAGREWIGLCSALCFFLVPLNSLLITDNFLSELILYFSSLVNF